MFDWLYFGISVIAAAIASVVGFGIGSLMTPLLNVRAELKIAVALVAVPHFVATLVCFWRLRHHVNHRVLVSFGVPSALGGLSGSLLSSKFSNPALTIVFSCLLILAGLTGVLGLAEKVRWGRRFAHFAGFSSGLFGGLVGNQGGIRAAALLQFELLPQSFVSTSMAVGLIIDIVRLPVYLVAHGDLMALRWKWLCLSIAGVLVGSYFGIHFLAQIPKAVFKRMVCSFILILGIAMFIKGYSLM